MVEIRGILGAYEAYMYFRLRSFLSNKIVFNCEFNHGYYEHKGYLSCPFYKRVSKNKLLDIFSVHPNNILCNFFLFVKLI